MACRLLGPKPLLDPVMVLCWLDDSQWNLIRSNDFPPWKCIYKNVFCMLPAPRWWAPYVSMWRLSCSGKWHQLSMYWHRVDIQYHYAIWQTSQVLLSNQVKLHKVTMILWRRCHLITFFMWVNELGQLWFMQCFAACWLQPIAWTIGDIVLAGLLGTNFDVVWIGTSPLNKMFWAIYHCSLYNDQDWQPCQLMSWYPKVPGHLLHW